LPNLETAYGSHQAAAIGSVRGSVGPSHNDADADKHCTDHRRMSRLAGIDGASQSPERHGCGPSSLAERLGGLQQQFDDEVTLAPEYDPRFLGRVAGPDYQSPWVWTYGGNINGVDHHQVRAVAGALALKAERARELLGLRECAENLVLAKTRLARGRRFSSHP